MTDTVPRKHYESDSLFAETTRRFTREKVIPRNDDLDQHPQDMKLIRKLLLETGCLGLYGAVIPPGYGGAGPNSLALPGERRMTLGLERYETCQ
ncbi:acyl-CoA dehydrogenase family protein [Acidiferrimicrobium sp. IK]|uniref:acyl-CoA dehydrogenase family protein n=1 Tax=Acidiferrimicrobium sp. IK TaxID=2871700 RepID=UPI0021CB0170|nr:acyl-CoA dehydrogenase family protein [Acidiferrimicrobium sp. IK]MCU4183883.1 acyl-CoA dehydrogenase family protein [Acidiferrimicrobium sp. IK]